MSERSDRVRPSACPLDCPDACSLEVTVDEGRVVGIAGSERNPYTAGLICGKVRRFGRHVYGEERVPYPRIRQAGREKGAPDSFRRAEWDEALSLIVDRIGAVIARRGAEAILPLSYGGSNGKLTEGALDERLFRRLGASRLDRALCAAPSGAANRAVYGKMPGTPLEDYEHASLIVIWGANPPATGMHLLPVLKRARDRGALLVVIDPRRTKLALRADLHLPLRPGTDLPLALCVIRHLFVKGGADREFLVAHTTGAAELEERAREWSVERAAEVCGLEHKEVMRFASMYAASSPAVVRCGWGVERNRHGGAATAAVLALPAVGGKFGVRGGGVTMSNGGAWKLRDLAGEPEATTRTININRLGRALEPTTKPPVDLLFVYNCNPLATLPEQNRVRRGLTRDDLFTVVFEQVMTDTAHYADVVLPATTFLEHHELRRGYGSTALQRGRPVIEALGEARPNYAVFGELLHRLGLAREGDAETPDELTRACLADEPAALAALERDGIAFPAAGSRPLPFVDVFPAFPASPGGDGKAHLFPEELERAMPRGLYVWTPLARDDAHPLALISPALEQMTSSTFGQLQPGPVPLLMHPDDAAAREIADGEVVRIFNERGEVRTAVQVRGSVRPGVVFLPKGLWSRHTLNGATANALAPATLADLAGGACFNDARVQVERWAPDRA